MLQPIFKVVLNGAIEMTDAVVRFEVTNASHFCADTFHLELDLGKLPSGYGLSYWGQSAGDEFEIFAGFKTGVGSSLKSLIYGQVDDVEVDPVQRSLILTGRDLSARFLDAKTAEHFQDQKASDIVAKLAARHGMSSSVTPTKQRVGTYYEFYHTRLTKDQSEWDLLTFLAEQEGYDLWVTGQTLNFQPPVAATAPPYVLQYRNDGASVQSGNFEHIKLHRSQTLAKDVIVIVRSWNQAQETVITAQNQRSQATKQGGSGTPQIFTFYPPNLTKDQADKFAAAKAEDITKHERVITGTLPGDTILTNRSLIRLTGTNSGWDQLYNVDTVTRRMSVKEGFSMDFRAKNHSTQSTTVQ